MNPQKVFLQTVVIIPCYNVEAYCESVLRETVPLCSHLIVINDGSTDGTAKIIQELCFDYPDKIHVITFPKNRGKGFGLLEGFKFANSHLKYKALVTIDSDRQHDPSLIPELTKPIYQGAADLSIGARTFSQMPLRNRLANTIIAILLRLIYRRAPRDTQSGMRCFSPDLIQDIVKEIPGGLYEMEFRCLLLALKKRRKIVEIPIPTVYINNNRSSHFSPLRDSYRILNVFFSHFKRKK